MSKVQIRNFSIIAHIDHGKSTLADRLIEQVQAVSKRDMKNQILDSLDIERERGITIKAQTVRLHYTDAQGQEYVLNLIDTPGHVDFSYEVSRSLSACEGTLLLVDASQGIEAQTLANSLLAMEHDLEIIPVINKIDLPSADVERVSDQLVSVIGVDRDHILPVSAKTGEGVAAIFTAIIKHVPAPKGQESAPLKALVFDSFYNTYQGVVATIRVLEGVLERGSRIMFMSDKQEYEALDVGYFNPKMERAERLIAGDVGYIVTGIKDVNMVGMGDTITTVAEPATDPFPGFDPVRPMVFCGLYPTESDQYEDLRDALSKLKLNDASFEYEPETSHALGFGFRCGFLGILHMEITQERLEREYGLMLITTAPNVIFNVYNSDGEKTVVDNPAHYPEGQAALVEEPFIKATIMTPTEYIGVIMQLCQDKRGQYIGVEYYDENHAMVTYELPLSEIVMDFYDKLKSVSRGYASLDYHLCGYRESDLVRVNMLINGEPVDALSFIVHKDKAFYRGRAMVSKLRELIPRQLFDVAIQAAVGTRIVSRETVKALRKNVTAKCYGGDISRKRKLLEKQKAGKKRMKSVGSISLPQDAFMAILKVD